MSVRFIIGRAGSGKTEYCINHIGEQLKQQPEGQPLILLVPEQASFQAESALIHKPGIRGIIRSQVLSFRRLAFRVMQETGGMARTPLDDMGKKMLLFRLLQKQKEELSAFSRLTDQIGFIDKCLELLKEFKRYNVDSAALENGWKSMNLAKTGEHDSLKLKLHDLVALYRQYDHVLGTDYLDTEDCLNICCEQLSNALFAQGMEVWIDGFHGFTPQEEQVIIQLAKVAKRVHITLCLDRDYQPDEQPNELDLFYSTALTMVRLKRLLAEQGLPIENTLPLGSVTLPRFEQNPVLGKLEAVWNWKNVAEDRLKDRFDTMAVSASIAVSEAQNRRAEVNGIARKILRHVRDDGYRWKDIAIMVRDMPAYEELIKAAFQQQNIPFFIDQKRSVLHHPLIELIRSSLEAVRHNWRHEAVFRCLKTDFFLPLNGYVDLDSDRFQFTYRHSGEPDGYELYEKLARLDRLSMDELENTALAYGLEGYKWTDLQPWTITERADLDMDEARFKLNTFLMDRIHLTRLWVVYPLIVLQEQLKSAQHIREMAEALFSFADQLQVQQRLEYWSEQQAASGQTSIAREQLQLWDRFIDMLDQMVELMGDEPLSLDQFMALLDKGFEGMKLSLVPPSLDQVFIGQVERSRAANVKILFMLGVNDGVYPARVQEDGIFTEQEREKLTLNGLELAPSLRRRLLDEQFMMYSLLTMPSHQLHLSYAVADEEGKALLPSEVIRRIKSWFPALKLNEWQLEPPAGISEKSMFQYIENGQQAVSFLVSRLQQWLNGDDIDMVWWELYYFVTEHPRWRQRMQELSGSLWYTNKAKPLDMKLSRLLYGDRLQVSVSRMERFTACPFAQFISHGLRLKERPIFKLDAPDIGQLFHAALNHMVKQVTDERKSWNEITDDESAEIAKQTVEKLAPRLQNEILLSSKRHQFIAGKLKNTIHQAFRMIRQHLIQSDFQPVALELAFGPGQVIPPLSYTLNNGTQIDVVGRIDRIDMAESEKGPLLRIIDYKSSEKQLDLTEFYYGLSLQMLTYLDVVITHSNTWLGGEARPAGVLYFHVHHPIIQTKNNIDAGQVESEIIKKFKMKGLVDADPTTVKLMDTSLENGYSPYIPVGLTKDGKFYANSSVASADEWDRLRRYARGTIRKVSSRLTEGQIDIKPYRLGKKSACTFCDYKSICQFDTLIDGNEYQQLRPLRKQDIFDEIERIEGEAE